MIENEYLLCDELASIVSLEKSKIIAIWVMMASKGFCKLNLYIYCDCTEDEPIDSMPFGAGFPSVPYCCPNCHENIKSLERLGFDVGIC